MRRLLILTASTVLLAACSSGSDAGGSDDTEPTPRRTGSATTPSGDGSSSRSPEAAPTGPDCDDVWKDGQQLPAGYESCVTDGRLGEADVVKCQDGSRLITYADQFFAVPGQRIARPEVAPIQDTEEYSEAYSACTGE